MMMMMMHRFCFIMMALPCFENKNQFVRYHMDLLVYSSHLSRWSCSCPSCVGELLAAMMKNMPIQEYRECRNNGDIIKDYTSSTFSFSDWIFSYLYLYIYIFLNPWLYFFQAALSGMLIFQISVFSWSKTLPFQAKNVWMQDIRPVHDAPVLASPTRQAWEDVGCRRVLCTGFP